MRWGDVVEISQVTSPGVAPSPLIVWMTGHSRSRIWTLAPADNQSGNGDNNHNCEGANYPSYIHRMSLRSP
jgi:hypothetical protein